MLSLPGAVVPYSFKNLFLIAKNISNCYKGYGEKIDDWKNHNSVYSEKIQL